MFAIHVQYFPFKNVWSVSGHHCIRKFVCFVGNYRIIILQLLRFLWIDTVHYYNKVNFQKYSKRNEFLTCSCGSWLCCRRCRTQLRCSWSCGDFRSRCCFFRCSRCCCRCLLFSCAWGWTFHLKKYTISN